MLFGHFIVGSVVAHLDGALQCIQTAHLGQTALDPLPAALHVGVDLTHAVLGAAALAVDQALGAGSQGADAAGEIQEARSEGSSYIRKEVRR